MNLQTSPSPNWSRTTKIIVTLTLLFLVGVMLTRFQYLVGPVVVAFIVAYLLHPISAFLHTKLRIKWRLSVGLVYLFVVLGLIVTGSAIYLFYRYRLQQALKIERLRTRLATDLHDDVGATLSAISMYADALKKQTTEPGMTNLLGKMGEDSREMVRTMSDLVWAINPRNDSGQKLIGRIENLALDLCAAAGVKLSFNNEFFESDEIFGIELRRNIFLIFKEAVNNALKYSGCSELTVTASLKEGRFTLEICDNGCGFDPLAVQQGNGLENMKLRAGELKGELSIQTSYGKGCCISLKCPV